MTEIILRILKVVLNFIYMFYKILPSKNKIVMISRQSNNINQDFKLLGEQLEKKHKVVYLCKTLKDGANAKISNKISYGFHMFRQMYHLATSKVCILDSYCPTVSILKHKKSLTVIQIWHSIGTLKKFGYTAIGKEEGSRLKIAEIMNMHKNYDVVYCSGTPYRDHLKDGFNISRDKIKIYTLPRIDLLSNVEYEEQVKEQIYKEYPVLKEKKNIVYAPTFRKDESEFNYYLEKLIENINFDKYNLILKLHPLSKVQINNENIIDDRKFSTFNMLFLADYLISDYSCIIYEAGIRNIPLYFYNYDIDKYNENRGLAIDYNELPGFKEKEAEKMVEDLEKDYDMEYLKSFIKKYVENTENCAQKMAEDIEKYM